MGCIHINIFNNNKTVPEVHGSENCLHLSVFRPEPSGRKLEVMVFLHGLHGCQKPGPRRWMEYGVILVTVNYRIQSLGFVSLGIDQASGNQGLRDQETASVV